MSELPKLKCDVCNENEAVGVAASPFGPCSFAYCKECLKTGREPYGNLVAALMGCESFDEIADWAKPSVDATLKAEGKTREDFMQDCKEAYHEYASIWLDDRLG